MSHMGHPFARRPPRDPASLPADPRPILRKSVQAARRRRDLTLRFHPPTARPARFVGSAGRFLLAWLTLAFLAGQLLARPSPPRYQLDPLCLAPQSLPVPLDPGNPPPSNRRMAERLAWFRDNLEPDGIAFRSDRLVPRLQMAWDSTPEGPDRFQIGLQLALHQAQLGRPDSALNTYDAMAEMLAGSGAELPAKVGSQIRMRRAVAFLRMGEQENCIARHGPESCLFPLSSAAYHLLPRGSLGAIDVLTQHLQSTTNDLSARWLLNIAYMTVGQYPDKVPPQWLVPPDVFRSDHPMPRFPDVAGQLGLDINDLGGGTIVDDFDNDGLLDVFASSWGLDGQIRFFRNRGGGRFTDRTSEAGLVGITSGLNILQTDFNNDGWLDVWITRGAWFGRHGRIPSSLLRNNGDGTFTDVTEAAGLLTQHPSQTSRWFDFDGDGWLDLFKGNETMNPSEPDPCELFRNNHDGTFTECAAAVGLQVVQFVKGVACGDFDNDGRPDLYLSCRNAPNLLFHNDGPAGPGPSTNQWRFSNVTERARVSDPVFSFPTWFFDYDNDGWEDLFVSGYGINNVGDIAADYLGLPTPAALPRLYRNNHDGSLSNVTAAVRLNRVCHTMGCNFGDLDNDGWLDFYLATGDPDLATLVPNRMFRNHLGTHFQDVSTATGTGHLQKGHGVAFADIDNDGDQDVYVVMGGAFPGDRAHNCLFQNPGSSNRWVHLTLVGTRANRPAIGARIHVNLQTPEGPRTLHRTVGSGGSFGANPLRQEIGLGNATVITSVQVEWPGSGTRQTFTGLQPGKRYRITEDQPEAEVLTPR